MTVTMTGHKPSSITVRSAAISTPDASIQCHVPFQLE